MGGSAVREKFGVRTERAEKVHRIARGDQNKWRGRRDSNPQPSVPKTDALSIELRPLEATILPQNGRGLC